MGTSPPSSPSADNFQSNAEGLLCSSISNNLWLNSPSATTSPPAYSKLPHSLAREGSISSVSSTASTLVSASRTRHRLRLIKPEHDEQRRAVEEEPAVVERLKHEGRMPELSAADVKLRVSKLTSDIQRAGEQFPQRSNTGLFKAVCSTDLLFLIDTTTSMSCYIDAAKQQVQSIVTDIRGAFLNEAEVRIAVVGYKDHGCTPNTQVLDFTTSGAEIGTFLAGLQATGGGDVPEDVLGGIQKALHQTWKHKTRCIIHIADAPPHGTPSHDLEASADRWPSPGTEPHRLRYEPLIEQMIQLNINYALLRVNDLTDRMALNFFTIYAAASAGCKLLESNKYYSKSREPTTKADKVLRLQGNYKHGAHAGLLFEEQELGTTYSALRHLVLKNVTSSASRTAVRSLASPARTTKRSGSDVFGKWQAATKLMSIDEEEGNGTADIELDTSVPQWDDPGWFDETLVMEGFCPDVVHVASTLNNMMAHDDNIKMNVMELTVRKRLRPFSQGALRVAFYARTAASTDRFVVKSFKRDERRIVHLAEDMRCQALCKAFAVEYNALPWEKPWIDFNVTTCLKGSGGETSDGECLSLEPYIEGAYVKYNNNCGYVNTDETNNLYNQSAQAFSHFTFERSRGQFLVSDLQGVQGNLTDPAVHTLDPNRFKLVQTNLGREGFKFFFSTHTCNKFCLQLGLKSNASMLISGRYLFRETWPKLNKTVCCSNKLCARIVHEWQSDTEEPFSENYMCANTSELFPGHYWCDRCWTQLGATGDKRICVAPGAHHEFEFSKFFYESQGRSPPRRCPEHYNGDDIVSRTKAAVTGGLNRIGVGKTEPPAAIPTFKWKLQSSAEVPSMAMAGTTKMSVKTELSEPVVMGRSLWARLRSAKRKSKLTDR